MIGKMSASNYMYIHWCVTVIYECYICQETWAYHLPQLWFSETAKQRKCVYITLLINILKNNFITLSTLLFFLLFNLKRVRWFFTVENPFQHLKKYLTLYMSNSNSSKYDGTSLLSNRHTAYFFIICSPPAIKKIILSSI